MSCITELLQYGTFKMRRIIKEEKVSNYLTKEQIYKLTRIFAFRVFIIKVTNLGIAGYLKTTDPLWYAAK